MLQILDTTLREGEQTPGIYFDKHIKLKIAKMLDNIGVNIIEAGHPAVTKEVRDSVKLIANSGFKATIASHARALMGDVKLALDCDVDFIGIFYSVSNHRLSTVFNKSIDAAIKEITGAIEIVKNANPDIIIRYTPEDTVRSEFNNVITASVAAVNAGADVICVADTTGYMVPGTDRNMFSYISKLKSELAYRNLHPKIAAHCHNDRGFALVNAIDAYRAGAEIIDASVLGLGERAGIVDLAQLLVVLSLDFGIDHWKLDKLDELYRFVSKHSGISIPNNYPIIGKHAFTHCAGAHAHAVAIDPSHYESINPKLLGKERMFSLDHMSGRASLKFALSQIKEENLSDKLQLEVLSKVKSIGQKGRVVELTELPHIIHLVKEKDKNKRL